jgi:hypothetical protein
MLPGDRVARQGLQRFEAGDSAGALELLHRAMGLGVSTIESVEIYLALTAGAGVAARGVEAAERFLEDERLDLPPSAQASLRAEILQASRELVSDGDTEGQRLLAALQAAALAGPESWALFEHPDLRSIIDAHLMPTATGLDLAEQLLYAPPETGWPETGLQRIETIGLAAAQDAELARACERLLHAAGLPDAAYRVERARRSRSEISPSLARVPARRKRTSLTGRTVAIAGGHPALRVMIGEEVAALDGSIREIPSRHEAVRRDKDVTDILRGANVVLVIIPQIAHSTSDQVKRAARRLSVPVIQAPTASVQSIIVLITQWDDEAS